MKKLILSGILMFIGINVAFADTYYSGYREYLLDSEVIINPSDTLKYEEKTLYNTYNEEMVNDGYEKENSGLCLEYDMNDKKSGYVYSSGKKTGYLNYQSFEIIDGKIKGIIFTRILNNPILYDLSVYSNGRKVSYKIINSNIKNDWAINDESIYAGPTLALGNSFEIVFDEEIDLYNLEIKTLVSRAVNANVSLIYETNTGICTMNKYIDAVNINWLDSYEYNRIKNTLFSDVETDNLPSYYRGEETLYRCRNLKKILTGNYTEDKNALNVDLSSTKVVRNYYIRDKVVISDEEISNKNFDLKDLITDSSIDLSKLIISSNINYDKNGTYKVMFDFGNGFVVYKDVVVNIKSEEKPVIKDEILEDSPVIKDDSIDEDEIIIKEEIIEEIKNTTSEDILKILYEILNRLEQIEAKLE